MLSLLAILIGVGMVSSVAQATTDPAAFEVATKWLHAVEGGDTESLTDMTSVPFTYATTAKVKHCERTVSAPTHLSAWANCIRKSARLLMNELRQGAVMPDPPTVESAELKRLAANISASGTWVRAYINGDGVTFSFCFLLVGRTVAAFLVDTEFETS